MGCSCQPSPALITFDGMRSARKRAAPDEPWRMTTMSMRIASRLRAVSTSVSPFATDDPVEEMLTVSALSRFSANSKETRVRVDASKKRLTIVLPRSTGTFLIRRSEISLKGSAVSRMVRICSALSPSRPTRSLPRGAAGSVTPPTRPSVDDLDAEPAVELGHEDLHALLAGHVEPASGDVGLDRELALTAVHQHAQEDPLAAAPSRRAR